MSVAQAVVCVAFYIIVLWFLEISFLPARTADPIWRFDRQSFGVDVSTFGAKHKGSLQSTMFYVYDGIYYSQFN